MTGMQDEFYLLFKGKSFADFLESINGGFHSCEKDELSKISTQSIIEYTLLLLDKIHFQEKYKLGFQLEYPTEYYLIHETNPDVRIKDSLTHIVFEPTLEFVWQAFLLTNAGKVLREINELVLVYGDLLSMYSAYYLNTFKWEPNINVFLSPKIFLAEHYARVETCWIEQNELGLYKEICEYDIRENVIRLNNRTSHLLLPPWGSDDYYESPLEKTLPF